MKEYVKPIPNIAITSGKLLFNIQECKDRDQYRHALHVVRCLFAFELFFILKVRETKRTGFLDFPSF